MKLKSVEVGGHLRASRNFFRKREGKNVVGREKGVEKEVEEGVDDASADQPEARFILQSQRQAKIA